MALPTIFSLQAAQTISSDISGDEMLTTAQSLSRGHKIPRPRQAAPHDTLGVFTTRQAKYFSQGVKTEKR